MGDGDTQSQVVAEVGLIGRVEKLGDNHFEAAEYIIPSPEVATGIWQMYRQAHLSRILLYAEIKGLIGGNPPYNPEELASAGLQHVSNFNDMSAGAIAERACLAYWNLLYSANSLVSISLRSQDPAAGNIGKILSEVWTEVVVECWPSFLINQASNMTQLVVLGASPVFFPDERDAKWRVIQMSRFYVPDQAQSDLDQLTSFCVETPYTLQYLWDTYKKIKDEDPKTCPWDKESLGDLLTQLSSLYNKGQADNWNIADLEQRLLNGDTAYVPFYTGSVNVMSLFQKEFDGTVTHMMFYPYQVNQSGKFLFRERAQYSSIAEAMLLYTASPGAYTIHENRGVGAKIFSLGQAKIQADCSLVDMIKFSSTPIVKSASNNIGDIDQIKFFPGVPTNIGTAEFVDSNLGSNINNVVAGVEYLSRLIEFNLTYSGSDPGTPDPDTGSVAPSQARLMAFREFGILKNNIQHFYSVQDRLYQSMTAKILRSKPADPCYEWLTRWKERSMARGVPEEIFEVGPETDDYAFGLPRHIRVQATRAAGHGSQVGLLIALQELNPFIGTFGPREQQEFMRLLITATLGPEFITAFMQDTDRVDETAGGASLAGVENAIMQIGKSPIFSMDNEHQSHFVIHMVLQQQIIELVNTKQMDVIAADKIFSVSVPHTGEHVQALAQSVFSQAFYAEAKPKFDQVMKFATLNKKNAERAAQKQITDEGQQAEQTQQVMSDEELKNMQVINDERRKDTKLERQDGRQQEQHLVKKELATNESNAKIAREAAEARSKIQLEQAGKVLEASVNAEITADPEAYLNKQSGDTPATYDIEGA